MTEQTKDKNWPYRITQFYDVSLCLYVADPATFQASNSPLRTSCLFDYRKKIHIPEFALFLMNTVNIKMINLISKTTWCHFNNSQKHNIFTVNIYCQITTVQFNRLLNSLLKIKQLLICHQTGLSLCLSVCWPSCARAERLADVTSQARGIMLTAASPPTHSWDFQELYTLPRYRQHNHDCLHKAECTRCVLCAVSSPAVHSLLCITSLLCCWHPWRGRTCVVSLASST